MGTARRQVLLNALKLFDLVLMVAGFLLASLAVLRETQTVSFSQFLSMRVKLSNFILFLALLWIWHLLFRIFGMYGSRRLRGRRADVVDIAKAVTLGTGIILFAAVAFHIRLVTHTFLVVFWVSTFVFCISSRMLMRNILERIRLRGRNLRYMLVIGTNPRAVEFARRISHKPELGYRVLGFADDNWDGLPQFKGSGFSLVTKLGDLTNYLRNAVVDEVVVGLPMRSMHTCAANVASMCEEQGITTRVLSNIFDRKLSSPHHDDLEGASLVTHYAGMAEGWPVLIKRILDITVSSILLAICAPLLILTAILIRLTSPGPILFTQNRLGFNKRRFKIYKFRTMVADAEQKIRQIEHLNEASGPVFKIKNDPRITPIGKFLRKTSIDELPQLFNVLKGDMSLVGPRPLPVRDYEGFDKDWQRRRFSVRPGITCLWQINGRSSIPFEKWMQLDLQYIDGWSLWLDFEILLKTIPAVLKGSGAA
jgi:exopolysaccharide biosynthesis polyprenyl glycosylphosphotransferase